MSKLTLTTEDDKHVVITRRFAASPEAVYRAHTQAKLIQKWLLGPEGWTMPVCICRMPRLTITSKQHSSRTGQAH